MSREGGSAPENREERRSFKREIADRLDVLRVGPFDVLVLHLPSEVIADQSMGGLFEQAQAGAVEVMEVAKRPVVLLPEGTKLTTEDVEPIFRAMMEEHAKDLRKTGVQLPPGIIRPGKATLN